MNVPELISDFNALNGKIVSKKGIGRMISRAKRAIAAKALDKIMKAKAVEAIETLELAHENIPEGAEAELMLSPIDFDDAVPEAPEVPEVFEVSKKNVKERLREAGFVFASETGQVGKEVKGLFRLKGEVGRLLGNLQRFRLTISISGATHSSKSDLLMQLLNGFLDLQMTAALLDLEHGGLQSKETRAAIDRNITKCNRQRLAVIDAVGGVDDIRGYADMVDVVAIDSGRELREHTNAWLNDLRKEYPETIFVVIWQQTTSGEIRGGSAAHFDSTVVIESFRPDENDHRKNYAKVRKNRGNPTNLYYIMNDKRTVDEPPI